MNPTWDQVFILNYPVTYDTVPHSIVSWKSVMEKSIPVFIILTKSFFLTSPCSLHWDSVFLLVAAWVAALTWMKHSRCEVCSLTAKQGRSSFGGEVESQCTSVSAALAVSGSFVTLYRGHTLKTALSVLGLYTFSTLIFFQFNSKLDKSITVPVWRKCFAWSSSGWI